MQGANVPFKELALNTEKKDNSVLRNTDDQGTLSYPCGI
jgi:hypothetical protein